LNASTLAGHVRSWHFCDIAIGRADVRSRARADQKIRRDQILLAR
jgi:hypothetical protein